MILIWRQNRLLEMIRQQQVQLQQMQQAANYTPATSTAAVDNSTPTSERSFSFPNVPASAPISINNPRARSPIPRSSVELSRQSSRQSRTLSRTGSPSIRPMSAGLQAHGDDWMLSAGSQSSRDDAAFYQAETLALTRENQMLKLRIRELGRSTARGNCTRLMVWQSDSLTKEAQRLLTVPVSLRIWPDRRSTRIPVVPQRRIIG